MTSTKDDLRESVHQLAEQAFHQGLISGHGDGEFDQEYQLVLAGKPRHFALEYARSFLGDLLKSADLESADLEPADLEPAD